METTESGSDDPPEVGDPDEPVVVKRVNGLTMAVGDSPRGEWIKSPNLLPLDVSEYR